MWNKYAINGFFGWENIKWLCRELLKVCSNEHSFFSKKRIEGGIAFFVLQWGMVYFLKNNIDDMEASEFFIWASIEAVVCGYALNKIQAEKLDTKTS